MDELQQTFNALVSKYTEQPVVAERLWKELYLAYTETGRFYHTPEHLQLMLRELSTIRSSIKSWEPILFALFYHDAVYNPAGKDNEGDSANLARKRMRQIGVMPYTISTCTEAILATKLHRPTENPDINYLLDADLAILGADWESYQNYAFNIRKEYALFEDGVYYPGRKQVLKRFLEMPAIYKTAHFSGRFEQKAKENLGKELQSITPSF